MIGQGPGGIAFPATGVRLSAAGLRRLGTQPDSCCTARSTGKLLPRGPLIPGVQRWPARIWRFREQKDGHNLALPDLRSAEAFRLGTCSKLCVHCAIPALAKATLSSQVQCVGDALHHLPVNHTHTYRTHYKTTLLGFAQECSHPGALRLGRAPGSRSNLV